MPRKRPATRRQTSLSMGDLTDQNLPLHRRSILLEAKRRERLCSGRDQNTCLITHFRELIEVAHIYPFTLGDKPIGEKDLFWGSLMDYWSNEMVDSTAQQQQQQQQHNKLQANTRTPSPPAFHTFLPNPPDTLEDRVAPKCPGSAKSRYLKYLHKTIAALVEAGADNSEASDGEEVDAELIAAQEKEHQRQTIERAAPCSHTPTPYETDIIIKILSNGFRE
ncbi:hypothetical protein BO78DRAFT_472424 [Aspergillus sclerotiicarbonarius CBS 121057]|uniref:HNH nuclease domain-containing protein n=1 Tax=Aspergillus sclerotiicarbonarius (strain CBS 121057 / IBT 28362) TaxID=1448318 RepID=A0A319DYE1_ASPSB|nr:hypothetical protein BO78DRAFT_472424 [Aspergillus sclerotiicarbonarius CBS 121057]